MVMTEDGTSPVLTETPLYANILSIVSAKWVFLRLYEMPGNHRGNHRDFAWCIQILYNIQE